MKKNIICRFRYYYDDEDAEYTTAVNGTEEINIGDIIYSYTYKNYKLLRAIYIVRGIDKKYINLELINGFGRKNLYKHYYILKESINVVVDWRSIDSNSKIWCFATHDDVNIFIEQAVSLYESDKIKCIMNHDNCGRLECIININQLKGYRNIAFCTVRE